MNIKQLKTYRITRILFIKPADKGGAVVVMDLKDYLAEGYKQLSDGNVYKKLSESKTLEYHNLIKSYLKHCYESDSDISRETFMYLTDFVPRTSRLYLLPKIHKNVQPPPERPVISSNGAPTERISQFVDFFLQPFVSKNRSYIKDTNDFLLKLQALGKLPENTILFSLDVVSLYTNIPTEMGLKVD